MDTEKFKWNTSRGVALGRAKKAFAAFVLDYLCGIGIIVLGIGAESGAWTYSFAAGISQVLFILSGVCALVLLCQLIQLWRMLR